MSDAALTHPQKHTHQWSYLHTVYEGRRPGRHEVGVVRYCTCGVKQMAFASIWRKPPKQYDLSDVPSPPSGRRARNASSVASGRRASRPNGATR